MGLWTGEGDDGDGTVDGDGDRKGQYRLNTVGTGLAPVPPVCGTRKLNGLGTSLHLLSDGGEPHWHERTRWGTAPARGVTGKIRQIRFFLAKQANV